MTRNLHIILSLLLGLAFCIAPLSCRDGLRTAAPAGGGNAPEGESCRVTFRISGAGVSGGTKVEAPDSAAECNIRQVQYLMFDENCRLEAYVKDPSPVVSMLSSPGRKKIYAIVNFPDSLGHFDTEDKMLSKVTDLADNAPDALIMAGHTFVDLPVSDTTLIQVRRFVARVTVGKVTADFPLPSMRECDFVLKAIYLTNVCAAMTLSGVEAPCDHWYCRGGFHRDIPSIPVRALVWSQVDRNLTMVGPCETEYAFYTYPNVTEEDSDGLPWSVRHTKIVLETEYNEKTYYYPIALPVLHSGKSYDIQEVCLTRPGSDDEDERVESLDATFTITVSDWETVADWGRHDGHREDNEGGTVVI